MTAFDDEWPPARHIIDEYNRLQWVPAHHNEDYFIGVIWWHRATTTNEWCRALIQFGEVHGGAMLAKPDAYWTMVEERPVTITPELSCSTCGARGVLTRGTMEVYDAGR